MKTTWLIVLFGMLVVTLPAPNLQAQGLGAVADMEQQTRRDKLLFDAWLLLPGVHRHCPNAIPIEGAQAVLGSHVTQNSLKKRFGGFLDEARWETLVEVYSGLRSTTGNSIQRACFHARSQFSEISKEFGIRLFDWPNGPYDER